MPSWMTRHFYPRWWEHWSCPCVWALGTVPSAPFGQFFPGLRQFTPKHVLTSTKQRNQMGPFADLQSSLCSYLLSGTVLWTLAFAFPNPNSIFSTHETARLHGGNPPVLQPRNSAQAVVGPLISSPHLLPPSEITILSCLTLNIWEPLFCVFSLVF